MKAGAIKIPAELFALAESSRFEGVLELGCLQAGPDDYVFDQPVTWSVDVTNTGSALLVQGVVQGRGTCACSRCLEDVTYDLRGEVEGYFLIGEQGSGFEGGFGEDESLGDEFDVLPDDHIIDLEPLIRAALLMDIPQMPLCRADCAGLCPSCGANLNEGPCGCDGDADLAAFERQANPFSVLADFDWGERGE